MADPWASEHDAMHEYGVTLTKIEDIQDADCVIVAVAHDVFKSMSLERIKALFNNNLSDKRKVIVDVKGIYSISELKQFGMSFWRL